MSENAPNAQLATLLERLQPLRERVLSDAILFAQTPSQPQRETNRANFMINRLTQAGVPDVASDELGNVIGIVPGRTNERTIMLVAHLDSQVSEGVDLNVMVEQERLVGTGVSGTSLGLAAACVLPEALEHVGISLDSRLVILGSTNSLGRQEKNGLAHHLNQTRHRPDFGLVVEGMPLGKLSCFSIGSVRGTMICETGNASRRQNHSWESALVVMTRMVSRILRIPVPRHPYTAVRLGRLVAGATHDIEPDHAELNFEIAGYDRDITQGIRQSIEDLAAEMAARYMADIKLDFFRDHRPGGLSFSHPLVRRTRAVMEELGIEIAQGHTASELAHFIARDIPAVTLGLSTGRRNLKKDDYALIAPIMVGLTQLIGAILEIDGGQCDVA